MAKLWLQDVCKTFEDGTRAVSAVNLIVGDGEFLVLVGPSGCGKSTLLRLISGLESATAGQIIIDDREVSNLPPKDRDIAMVFQNYALYPHMTVFDNMAFALKMKKYTKAEIVKRVNQAAETLSLSPYLNKKPRALSGGQLQRVALGRAIVRQPKLFLFDEPLSNLDAKLRLSMRAELKKLHKTLQATMIYVTHDQIEAMSMGSRLVVLKDGIVQQVGPPLEIYQKPANVFVADFIGSPAMNFITCSLSSENETMQLSTDSFVMELSQKLTKEIVGTTKNTDQIIAGIRPEHLLESPPAVDQNSLRKIHVQVDFLEPMGNEILATCRIGSSEIIARLNATTSIEADKNYDLYFDINMVKFFNTDSGTAI